MEVWLRVVFVRSQATHFHERGNERGQIACQVDVEHQSDAVSCLLGAFVRREQ